MSDYEPLEWNVDMFKGKREALIELLQGIQQAVMSTKHPDFEFTCTLKEVKK